MNSRRKSGGVRWPSRAVLGLRDRPATSASAGDPPDRASHMVAAAIRIAELMIEREQAVAKIGPVCELDKRSRYAIPGAYLSQDDLGQLGALCVCRADRRPDNESQRHPAILTGHSGALEQALDPSWVAIAADRFGQPVCGAPCVWARGDLLDDFAGDCLITGSIECPRASSTQRAFRARPGSPDRRRARSAS